MPTRPHNKAKLQKGGFNFGLKSIPCNEGLFAAQTIALVEDATQPSQTWKPTLQILKGLGLRKGERPPARH